MNSFKVIKKYWQNTPELFSEKYTNNFFQNLSPVNIFLSKRRMEVLKLTKNLEGKKVLDVGCGSGILMLEFLKRGATVTGIDYSQKMLDLAKQELNFYKVDKKKYKLILANATNLPFSDKSFDLVLATGLTDYMSDKDNQKFIKEAARVLKKDGSLIVSFPVENSPFSIARYGIGLKIRQKVFKLPPIQNQFSLEKIRNFLKKEKMVDIKHTKIFATMWLVLAKAEKPNAKI